MELVGSFGMGPHRGWRNKATGTMEEKGMQRGMPSRSTNKDRCRVGLASLKHPIPSLCLVTLPFLALFTTCSMACLCVGPPVYLQVEGLDGSVR